MSQAKEFFENDDYLSRFSVSDESNHEDEPRILNSHDFVDDMYISNKLSAIPSVLDENYCSMRNIRTYQYRSDDPVIFNATVTVFISPREVFDIGVGFDGTSKGFTDALREYADSFDVENGMKNFQSYEDLNIVTGELEKFEPRTSAESVLHTIYQVCDKLDEIYKTDFTGDDIQRGLELAKDVLKFEYKIPSIEKYESNIDLSAKIVSMRESPDSTLTFDDIYRELKDVYDDVSFGDIEKYAPELAEIAADDDSYEGLVSRGDASDNSSDLVISDGIRKSEYYGEDIQRGLDIAKDVLKSEYKIPSIEKYESSIDLSAKIVSMRESPDSTLTFDDIYRELKDVYDDVSFGDIEKYAPELAEIAASDDSHEGMVDKETVSVSASSIIDSAFSTNVPERTEINFTNDDIKSRFPVISKIIEENGGKMHDFSGATRLYNPFIPLGYTISISLPSILAKDSPEIDRDTGFLPLDKGGEPYTIGVWFDGTVDGLVEEIRKEANDFEPNDAVIEFHFYEYYDSSTHEWDERSPLDRAELMEALLNHIRDQVNFIYKTDFADENALLGVEIATEVLKHEYDLPNESSEVDLAAKIAYVMECGGEDVSFDELYKAVKETYEDVSNGDIEKYVPALTDIVEKEDQTDEHKAAKEALDKIEDILSDSESVDIDDDDVSEDYDTVDADDYSDYDDCDSAYGE